MNEISNALKRKFKLDRQARILAGRAKNESKKTPVNKSAAGTITHKNPPTAEQLWKRKQNEQTQQFNRERKAQREQLRKDIMKRIGYKPTGQNTSNQQNILKENHATQKNGQ